MLAELLTLASLPAAADAALRTLFALRADRAAFPEAPAQPDRWLVIVPARDEGSRVEPTLRSLAAAARGRSVSIVLLLDGDDPIAGELALGCGAEVVVKTPPGPSKAAALAWFATRLGEGRPRPDAVLVLDVGSTVPPDFFDHLRWSLGSDALQTYLQGEGGSIGRAAAHSEHAAQRLQDRGRSTLGWSVQLRGTGMAFRPEAFADVFSNVGTKVEDLEATLWLMAAGRKIGFPSGAAVVLDVKPEATAEAAIQRSRWLAGRVEILLFRLPWMARLAVRRPLEGAAFLIELLSRPISLTMLLRIAAAAALVYEGEGMSLAAAAVLALSVVLDVIYLRAARRIGWKDASRLVLAWLGALLALPLALVRWMRSRRS